MENIDLTKHAVPIKLIDGKRYVFDVLRKKYVVLTPEELVRQTFIKYLIDEKGYPKSLCKLESGLKYGDMSKRSDIIFYNSSAKPFLLIECKSFKTKLSQSAFDQLSVYNQVLKAKFIGVTNGVHYKFCKVDYQSSKLDYLENIPEYLED